MQFNMKRPVSMAHVHISHFGINDIVNELSAVAIVHAHNSDFITLSGMRSIRANETDDTNNECAARAVRTHKNTQSDIFFVVITKQILFSKPVYLHEH